MWATRGERGRKGEQEGGGISANEERDEGRRGEDCLHSLFSNTAFHHLRRFRSATPNACHAAMASLEASGLLSGCITQNVDGLHQAAGMRNVVDLHGCGHDVVCLKCGDRGKRTDYHDVLIANNEEFYRSIGGGEEGAEDETEMRPDGDADLGGVNVDELEVSPCQACGDGLVKPDVVFFGANVERNVVDKSYGMCDDANGLIVAGSR